MRLVATSSQTVGPFFHIGMKPLERMELAGPGANGEHVEIKGQVLDGDGCPVSDAVLEIWQADANGAYATKPLSGQESFRGFGRVSTDGEGRFHFSTIKPGCVPEPGERLQAPHLAISLFMRGLLKRLVTRMYFPGETANESDPVLGLVEPARRVTLVARVDANTPSHLRWDIHLQGDQETVFFDC